MRDPIECVVIRVQPSEEGFSVDVYASSKELNFYVTNEEGDDVEPTDGGVFEGDLKAAIDDAVDTAKNLIDSRAGS